MWFGGCGGNGGGGREAKFDLGNALVIETGDTEESDNATCPTPLGVCDRRPCGGSTGDRADGTEMGGETPGLSGRGGRSSFLVMDTGVGCAEGDGRESVGRGGGGRAE